MRLYLIFLGKIFLETILFITLNVILEYGNTCGLVKNGLSKVINYSVFSGKSSFTVHRYQSVLGYENT